MSDRQTKAMIAIGVLISLLLALTVGPFFTIWSLNTLFRLEIEYSFKSWMAVLWLLTVFHGIRIVIRRRD